MTSSVLLVIPSTVTLGAILSLGVIRENGFNCPTPRFSLRR
jgi:hypothetical protein